MRAALVLVQAWIAAGRPLSRARLGSFQTWAGVMGGVLDVARVDGFLGNLDALYAHADTDDAAWREFTQAWWDAHGGTEVHVSLLAELYEKHDLMAQILGDGSTRSQQVRLGRALPGARDRSFGQLQVVVGNTDRKGRTLYALKHLGESSSPHDAPPAEGGAGQGHRTHWVPYDEDLDGDL